MMNPSILLNAKASIYEEWRHEAWGYLNIIRSRFFNAKFDGFGQLSQKVLKLLKSFIAHLNALIFSSLQLS